jgi:hypothetical protein
MALLTTGNWYEVTWLQTNNAAWAAMSPPPGIPPGMADAFVNGTAMVIYVTDSGSGSFVYAGGDAIGFDDTLLATDLALTAATWTTTAAVDFEYCTDSSNNVWYYNSASGTLQAFGVASTAAFKAYLP